MDLEKELYDLLNSSGYNVYAEIAPQNKPKPYVVYNMITDTKRFGLKCKSDIKDMRFYVDIYSKTYQERKDIISNIENLILTSNLNIILYNISNTNENGEIFRSNLDLKIWSNN